MQEQDDLSGAERKLVGAMKRLQPAAGGLDASKVMFEAGRRAAHRHLAVWRGTAIACVGVLGMSIWLRPRAIERTVYVNAPAVVESSPTETVAVALTPPVAGFEYLKLRTAVLERGLAALPNAQMSNGCAVETAMPSKRNVDEN